MEKRPIIKGADGLPGLLKDPASRTAAYAALTPAQRAVYDALRALVQDAARYKRPGAGSDHSDFYDEKGLPV